MKDKQDDGSVESIYQKKTQLEHILLRPDTYIGSTEPTTKAMWVVDKDGKLVNRKIDFVPGLYKIFDEILVNAADNKQRDPEMDLIKINIDPKTNSISIWNNGKGIPVVEHKTEKMYVPALIFGHLLTSSNYDDTEKRVVGGRHGFGAKLCNIFSNKFTVTTACKENNKQFEQTWTDNMTKTSPAKISEFEGSEFTEITFQPDLKKFQMTGLDEDTVALLTRRAYDIAGVSRGVRVMLNGKEIPVNDFESYARLYLQDKVDEDGEPLHMVYEFNNQRWEVGLAMSNKGFQHVSFVNGIATTKGGTHVDYITKQITKKLVDMLKPKFEKVKPYQVKGNLWMFINALIENPTFDSQTKENLTLLAKKFGSACNISDSFIKEMTSSGILNNIQDFVQDKQVALMDKKSKTGNKSKLMIPKLHDANMAGTKHSRDCTLILTEGDSAKALAVSGLAVVGRDYYGVFPLRGKILNVRDATHKQITENVEINTIGKILGLQYRLTYEKPASLKKLRYGKLMIMADQDTDGSHIKGLVINFIHSNWPNLLKHDFVDVFITPIVKVSKGRKTLSFFSLPEYEEWKQKTPDWKKWKIKYYKGLGTSTTKEGQEYFRNMDRHRIAFNYGGPEDDAALDLAFARKNSALRKEWLTNWLARVKSRREAGLGETYLYRKNTRNVTFNEFVNKELVVYSNADNIRQIPSIMDGFKPCQRKIIYAIFKNYEKKEVKVSQLGGAVSEATAYRHGEEYLMDSIITMAQNFVGTNNINLLQPIGQFGTRLQGGKDAANPRYIYTRLSPLARLIFPALDDPLLTSLYEDNQVIEPKWYCPIIPMVLVNGSHGIGTGWNTRIFNHDVRDIVYNLRLMLNGEEPEPMTPFYKNFRGNISKLSGNRYQCSGEIGIFRDENIIEITDLPLFTWTQDYQEEVLEKLLNGSNKTPKCPKGTILGYQEYHTDTTVKFVIKMKKHVIMEAEYGGIHKFFRLMTTLTQNTTMILFDSNGNIKKYNSVEDILREFFRVRLDMYQKRKDYKKGLLEAESSKLNNQSRFIMEKIQGDVIIENKSNKDIAQQLISRDYDSDPLLAYKATRQANIDKTHREEEVIRESEKMLSSDGRDYDYRYLLRMQMWALTKEKVDRLLKQKEAKAKELATLQNKSANQLWEEDLDRFMQEFEHLEAVERGEMKAIARSNTSKKAIAAKKKMTGKKTSTKKQAVTEQSLLREDTRPTPGAEWIKPRINFGYLKKPGLTKKVKGSLNKKKEPVPEETTDAIENETPPMAIENDSLPAALVGMETTHELGDNSLPAAHDGVIQNGNQLTVAGTSNVSSVRNYSVLAPPSLAENIGQGVKKYSTSCPLLVPPRRQYSVWTIPYSQCRGIWAIPYKQYSVWATPHGQYSMGAIPHRQYSEWSMPHRQYIGCSTAHPMSNLSCVSRISSSTRPVQLSKQSHCAWRYPSGCSLNLTQCHRYSSPAQKGTAPESYVSMNSYVRLMKRNGRLQPYAISFKVLRLFQRFPVR